MKKVFFTANLPSPYRVDFFNELGKYCDLTVLYERRTSLERDKKWVGEKAQSFKEVYLDLTPIGTDRSKGSDLKKYIQKNDFDILVITNYVSPAVMEAIIYCRFHRIPYCLEYDGGFNKKDRFPKSILKKFLLGGAQKHLTTADEHIKYLKSLGIDETRIYKYPFTSLKKSDIKTAENILQEDKSYYRKKLGIVEKKVVLSVGRFSYEKGYGKGYDVLLEVSKKLEPYVGIYIVGDEPTREFIELKEKNHLDHVHFVGFKVKADLAEYYVAADIFIMLTRGDVWGLVINEAMMYGLPIITTPYCIAGTELVSNDVNGNLVELEDIDIIQNKIVSILKNDKVLKKYSAESRLKISEFTIEKMASVQFDILSENRKWKE